MRILIYFFVALIAAGSVLAGLDFVSAPMSPMPASKYEIRAAVPPAPPAPAVARAEPKTEAAASAKAAAAAAPVATPAPIVAAPVTPPPAAVEQTAPIAAPEPVVAAAPAPRCDVEACTDAYRSFTAIDCTYQPSDGPRRFCTKGNPPPAASAAGTTPATAAPEARAQACNISACAAAYPRSFNAEDCTFRPAEGPRRACTK